MGLFKTTIQNSTNLNHSDKITISNGTTFNVLLIIKYFEENAVPVLAEIRLNGKNICQGSKLIFYLKYFIWFINNVNYLFRALAVEKRTDNIQQSHYVPITEQIIESVESVESTTSSLFPAIIQSNVCIIYYLNKDR